MSDIYCSITGIEGTAAVPDSVADDLPIGWALVTVTIRRDNPEYLTILSAKDAMIAQQLSQIPEDQHEAALPIVTVVAKASLAALLGQTPRYLYENHEVEISAESIPGALEALGIEEEERETVDNDGEE